jgi:hypothetical protein
VLGRPEPARRGGYPSQAAARRARDEWLAGTAADRTAAGWTVQRWLRRWLDTRTHLRATTRFHYTRDVERILVAHLGRYRLTGLDAGLLRTGVHADRRDTQQQGAGRGRRRRCGTCAPPCASRLTRRSRKACSTATRPRHIEISGYQQPHAKVWTDTRVEFWEQTGDRPAVAVWTAEQLATFLGAVTDDSLFAFWWLTALRGLRRGEMRGLRWVWGANTPYIT